MLRLARTVTLSHEQDCILTAAYVRSGKLTADQCLLQSPTDAELAAKYAVSPRTVRYWRKAGCPFPDGQWRVLAWIAARRYAPAGTEAKFKRQLARHRVRHTLRELHASMADARQIKLAHKLHGIELPPSDWLRNFRCPKRSVSP